MIAPALSRSDLLQQLDSRLESLQRQHGEAQYVVDCADQSLFDSPQRIETLRNALCNECGVVVALNAVDREEMIEARKWIGECMIDMFAADHQWPQSVCEALRSGDLYAANALRNPSNGFLLSSFGYIFKQLTKDDETPEAMIGDERVKFVEHPVHHRVLMRLMCERPTAARTALLLALSSTPDKAMISWDSVKVAGGARHKRMSKQERTIEHIDEYGARYGDRTKRVQAIINDDQDALKLCFVPHTNDAEVRRLIARLIGQPRYFESHGFKRLPHEHIDVINVLDKYAVAPPQRAMVCWASGIVHYEALTRAPGAGESMHRFVSRDTDAHRSARRLRFVMGTHTPVHLDDAEWRRLAVIAARGAVPDYNQHINKKTALKLYENIMNNKKTQWKKPRVLGERERAVMQRCLAADGVEDDWRALSPLYKHLYGVSQPLNSLGFTARQARCLETFFQ